MIDWTKPIQTKDGNKAWQEFTLKTASRYKHIVFVEGVYSEITPALCDDFGVLAPPVGSGIINVPEKRDVWINVSRGLSGGLLYDGPYESKEQADAHAAENRTACARFTYTEGEGL
jgi:hypothetical protein